MSKLKADLHSNRSTERLDRSYYHSRSENTPVFHFHDRRRKKLVKKLDSAGHTYKPEGRMESRWKRDYLEAFEEPAYVVGYY